jgi:hypothetical protein
MKVVLNSVKKVSLQLPLSEDLICSKTVQAQDAGCVIRPPASMDESTTNNRTKVPLRSVQSSPEMLAYLYQLPVKTPGYKVLSK